jgi:hypothetical protein
MRSSCGFRAGCSGVSLEPGGWCLALETSMGSLEVIVVQPAGQIRCYAGTSPDRTQEFTIDPMDPSVAATRHPRAKPAAVRASLVEQDCASPPEDLRGHCVIHEVNGRIAKLMANREVNRMVTLVGWAAVRSSIVAGGLRECSEAFRRHWLNHEVNGWITK